MIYLPLVGKFKKKKSKRFYIYEKNFSPHSYLEWDVFYPFTIGFAKMILLYSTCKNYVSSVGFIANVNKSFLKFRRNFKIPYRKSCSF